MFFFISLYYLTLSINCACYFSCVDVVFDIRIYKPISQYCTIIYTVSPTLNNEQPFHFQKGPKIGMEGAMSFFDSFFFPVK